MSQAAAVQVSETPRVDAAERFMHAFGKPPVGFVLSEVARALERELSLAWSVIEGRASVEELTALQAVGQSGGGAIPGAAAPRRRAERLSSLRRQTAEPKAEASAAPAAAPAKESAGENKEYAAGEVLFNKGDSADHLAIIISGEVEIFDPKDNKSIAILGKGVSFGEQAILEGGVRGASARAYTDVVCLEIPTGPLRTILKADPGIMTPTIEGLLLQLNMINTLSKKLPRNDSGIDFRVMEANNMTSVQAKKMLEEHYVKAGGSGLSGEVLMFLKLQVNSMFNTTVHNPGDVLMRSDEKDFTSALILVDGVIEAVSPKGTYQLGCGSLFGLAEGLTNSSSDWTLMAQTKVTLINLPIDRIQRGLTHANPAFRRIVSYTADRIVEIKREL